MYSNLISRVGFIFFAVFFTLGILFMPSGATLAQSPNTPTIETLKQQISQLLELVGALQKQLLEITSSGGGAQQPAATQPTQPVRQRACPIFTYNLYFGLKDNETEGQVTELQEFLAKDSSIYPEGMITGYFGPLTEQAVKRWQARHGVVSGGSPETTGYGVIGPKTRVKVREVCGAVVAPPINQPPPFTPPAQTIPPQSSPSVDLKINGTDGPLTAAPGYATFTWSSVGANLCKAGTIPENPLSATNWTGVKSTNGSESVWLSGDKTDITAYTITCTNNNSEALTDSVTVNISSAPSITAPPVLQFFVSPETIKPGQEATLTWKTTNADLCISVGSQMPSSLGTSGSIQVKPLKSAVYKLLCSGKGGSVQKSVTVNISSAPSSSIIPSITVLSPNGGEVLQSGRSWNVNWYIKNPPSDVENWSIQIALIPELRGKTKIAKIPLKNNTSFFNWNVPVFSSYPTGEKYRIEISLVSATASADVSNSIIMYSDASDASFTIISPQIQPSITVLSPNGGEIWTPSFQEGYYARQTVQWKSVNGGLVDGYLYRTSGQPVHQYCDAGSCGDVYRVTFQGQASGGQATISLPENIIPANDYKIHLSMGAAGADKEVAADDSDLPFSIIAPETTNKPEPKATLSLRSDDGKSGLYNVGSIINMAVYLKLDGTSEIGGVDASYINYNPSLLEVIDEKNLFQEYRSV